MNKAKLKTYAPQARRDFIQMIRQRADLLGLTKSEITPAKLDGDFSIIDGRAYQNKNYAHLHKKLAETIKSEGLEQLIERIAYSWFNRFAALRFMEINNFLSHEFRVLSNREEGKDEPEILTHAAEIELAGLDKSKVIELKLAGNKDAELYRRLLIAQCNELNRAMPFLFERINDETEILLPDNLLHSDSVIRKMVAGLVEEDWTEVEIIGWLYQFYISEKKDEVIGKTVKSEDIPAATQLFTPNWIVKYMTQNSLGRLWLEANPHSQLATRMEFYIKPLSATSAVADGVSLNTQNAAISPTTTALNPEEIKILDPACGSGHILVEAYELLKAIYTERGYSSRDIPLLILEKNLFGLDIDGRAGQLASFALLMKARRDDRRIFEKINTQNNGQRTTDKYQIPNIITIPDSSALQYTAREIAEMFFSEGEQTGAAMPIRDNKFLFDEMQIQPSLTIGVSEAETRANASVQNFNDSDVSEQNVIDLLELFEQGKTLGSLIRIPLGFSAVIDKLEKAVEIKRKSGNFLEQVAAKELETFVRAGKMLATKYDCVITNPPYMGGKGMNSELKAYAARNFADSKSDLFAMFIERGFELAKKDGFNAMVTMQSWMFLSSFEKIREKLLEEKTIISMAHLGARAFAEISGEVVQTTSFVMLNKHLKNFKPIFFRLVELSEPEKIKALRNSKQVFNNTRQNNFKKIPGSPIAYWVSNKVVEIFDNESCTGDVAKSYSGLQTNDTNRFLRQWYEVSSFNTGFGFATRNSATESGRMWFPHNKGGDFRKWYGNNDFVINWRNDGEDIRNSTKGSGGGRIVSSEFYFQESISSSAITSSENSYRFYSEGALFDVNFRSFFGLTKSEKLRLLGFLNSNVVLMFLNILSPTLAMNKHDLERIPYKRDFNFPMESIETLIDIAKSDWDSFETSWDFKQLPWLPEGFRLPEATVQTTVQNMESEERHTYFVRVSALEANSVEGCWITWKNLCDERINRMQELETENNRLFIEAYGLEDELKPEVPLKQITLVRADAEKDTRRLLLYFIGCLMGRYSLDETGLIYADAGNLGFDPLRYQTFAADDDGIVPVTDLEWFPQEAAQQFEKFIRTAWGDANLSQNLRWIAAQLGAKSSETPTETVRRYFSTSFFKDHLQTYKKRPIYWLFSSGKQKAFECLVYLHRYNESTLPRMRHEYVLPLMSKLTAQIETLEELKDTAATTSEKTKLEKQIEALRKKQIELAGFDEKLRHYSDMRISLDLDDGVRVNYGKFGDLLAEVKQVATTKE